MSDHPVSPSPSELGPTTAPEDDRYQDLLAAVRQTFASAASENAISHVFTTELKNPFETYLDSFPPSQRQRYTCSACRKFLERYASLVTVDQDGRATSIFWDSDRVPDRYKSVVKALAEGATRAPISGIFLTKETAWGYPRTGEWEHLAVVPKKTLLHRDSVVNSASQVMAAKRQDFETLLRALETFPIDLVKKAHALLSGEALYRSEASLGVATWLLELHKRREGAKNDRLRENLTWLAVAKAPPGFCHVRTTMIGTLLEDLEANLPMEDVQRKFAAKMHPLTYQRAQVAPSAGNIERAEKVVAALNSAGALERRFALLKDIKPLWLPKGGTLQKSSTTEKQGVFAHLKAAAKGAPKVTDMPGTTMTWEKFQRTVVPTAKTIEFVVPSGLGPYVALVTAQNPEAPPIFQWDLEDHRNPVSLYVYVMGSPPEQWNLKAGTHHPVTAITLKPWMWHPSRTFEHHGAGVIFVLEGAKDTRHTEGGGFFPSYLKSEYHEIRATMEAYANRAMILGKDDAEACGIVLSKGSNWNQSFRVTTEDGMRTVYNLDRWD